MRDDGKAIRQDKIEQAAYAVLEEKGYAGTSMLAIARQARASNETLYKWYGDKTGLFQALVRRNAADVKALLAERVAGDRDPLETLELLGPLLIALVTSHRAIALNRAAAADPTGELGKAIGREGRNAVAPLIARVLDQARAKGWLAFDDLDAACETYLGLLIGDLQIRCVVGRMPPPSAAARTARARSAVAHLRTLFAPRHRGRRRPLTGGPGA